MKAGFLSVFGWITLICSPAYSATAISTLLNAKQQAETKGYIFLTSHEEIVERAKKEGKLRVLSSQEPVSTKAMVAAFNRKYPSIEVNVEEVNALGTYQRILQEMKAGLAKNWDVNYLAWDSYAEYLPFLKKFDILGMAEQGVLQIPSKMVDPIHRHVVALQSNIHIVAYNKELISSDKVPNTWEDFLKPEFQGKKFALDVRAKALPPLVPVWGLEKVLDMARKLAAQKPIWYQGESRVRAQLAAGEFSLLHGPNYKGVIRQQKKDARKVIEYKVTEPVPARLSEAEAILAATANPHAALLWLEFQAGPEGQRILDNTDIAASILSLGSVHEQLTRGKRVSTVGWEHFQRVGEYEKKIVEALGFPSADTK
jgi:ABC-type Fe3+ transport system substrate-binding protein